MQRRGRLSRIDSNNATESTTLLMVHFIQMSSNVHCISQSPPSFVRQELEIIHLRQLLFLHRIPPCPVPGLLFPQGAIPPQLLCNSPFHCIIRVRLLQQLSRKFQHCGYFGGRLPLLGLQHAKTHYTSVGRGRGPTRQAGGRGTRRDIRVVDLGCKGKSWGVKGILRGECEEEIESAALFPLIRGINE